MPDSNSKTHATSHLAGYCEEIERIAGTVQGMLAQCRTLGFALGEDRQAVESLRPVLESLIAQVIDTLEHDVEHGKSAPIQNTNSSGARTIDWSAKTPQSSTAESEPVEPTDTPIHTFEQSETPISAAVESVFESRIEPNIEELEAASATPGFPAMHRCADVLMADLKRQTGHDDPEGTHGEITFQGTNESLPLASVFEMVGATKKTGRLSVKTNEELLTFEVVDGELVASSTSNPPPRQLLGQILIDFGFVEQKDLETFLAAHESPPRLGEALETGELVDLEELRTALEYQVRHRLLRAFRADPSAFTFSEGGSDVPDDRVRFNVAELLLERRMST